MSREQASGGHEKEVRPRNARVFIVDDHELMRDGLRLMLDHYPDLECCGQAAEEGEAVRLIRKLLPDVAVIDIGLKSGDGISLIKQIKSCVPSVRIIVYSMHGEQLYGERALRAGASGYVDKQDSAGAIRQAIQHVLDGKMHFSQKLIERVLQRVQAGAEVTGSPIEALSDRELDVFRLIGQGTSTREIAEKLYLSINTVNTYRQRLKIKLNLKSGVELARRATEWVVENP